METGERKISHRLTRRNLTKLAAVALPASIIYAGGCSPLPETIGTAPTVSSTAPPDPPPPTSIPTATPPPVSTAVPAAPTATPVPTAVPSATAVPSIPPAPLKATVRIGLPWPDAVLKTLVEADAKSRGSGALKLEVVRLAGRPYTNTSSYDVLGVSNPVQAARAGQLASIPESMVVSDYSARLLNPYRHDGRLSALPLAVSVRSFVYRSDLFATAGLDPAQPPASWEALASTARLLTRITDGRVERAGLDLSLSANTSEWLLFGWQNGGRVWSNEADGPLFNSTALLEAARYFRSFFRDPPGSSRLHSLPADPTKSAFGAGLAAMALRDFHEIKSRSEMPAEILATVRLAPPPASVAPVAPGRGRMLLGIAAGSRNFDAAAAAIERLSEPAMARALTRTAGLAPARTSLQGELETDDSRYRTYFRSLDLMRDWRSWPLPGVIADARRATPRLALSADPIEAILADVTRQARDRVSNAATDN